MPFNAGEVRVVLERLLEVLGSQQANRVELARFMVQEASDRLVATAGALATTQVDLESCRELLRAAREERDAEHAGAEQLRARLESEHALVVRIDKERAAEGAGHRAYLGEVREALSDMVTIFREETSQGDGVNGEHVDRYNRAVGVLGRAKREAGWDYSMAEVQGLILKAAEVPGLSATVDELRAEVERMKAEKSELDAALDGHTSVAVGAWRDMNEMTAELERLRALVRKVAEVVSAWDCYGATAGDYLRRVSGILDSSPEVRAVKRLRSGGAPAPGAGGQAGGAMKASRWTTGVVHSRVVRLDDDVEIHQEARSSSWECRLWTMTSQYVQHDDLVDIVTSRRLAPERLDEVADRHVAALTRRNT